MIWFLNWIEIYNILLLMDFSVEIYLVGWEFVVFYKVLFLKLFVIEVFIFGVMKVRMSVCGVDIKFFK